MVKYLQSLLLFIIYILLSLVIGYYKLEIIKILNWSNFLYIFVSTLLLLLLCFPFYNKLVKTNINSIKEINFKRILILFLLVMTFFLSTDFIMNFYFIINFYDLENALSLDNKISEINFNILIFINLVFLRPLFEELFFKGILLNNILKISKTNFLIPVFFTSILFSFDHVNPNFIFDSIPKMILMLLFSIVTSFIFIKTKNLVIPILFHMSYNLLSYILEFKTKEYTKIITFFNFDYRYWLITIFLIFLFFYLFFIFFRYKTVGNGKD